MSKSRWSVMQIGKMKEIIGEGAAEALGEEIAARGVKKALIVTDDGVVAAGHVARISENLKAHGVDNVIYDGVRTDPLDEMVREGLKLLNEQGCDGVLAVGGGSSMDTAKAISAMKYNEGDIMEYTRHTEVRRGWKAGRLPLFFAVTTAGTGSQQSPYAVITNTKINRKCNVTSDLFYPDLIILDATLTYTLNQKWTASCGFDTLAHAIDGYTVKQLICVPNDYYDTLALKAIELTGKSLRQAYAIPQNYEARKDMLVASDLAGLMLSAGTGATHGLANMLSKYYHVPHGESVGMLLPYVMEYNMIASPERFRKVAEALGIDTAGMTDMEAGHAAVDEVKQLIRDVHLPYVCDYIKEEKEIYNFLEESLPNTCNYANAREINYEAAEWIFVSAFRKE